jgi:LTXXQ motif family protein
MRPNRRSSEQRGAAVDSLYAKPIMLSAVIQNGQGDRSKSMETKIMVNPTLAARVHQRSRFALGAVVVMLLGTPLAADAQGLVKGVQQGAEAGNKAAGPVGGVLGGAIGGVVGVFTGVLGVGGQKGQTPPANDVRQTAPGKTAKTAKGAKAAPAKTVEVLTQPGQPELTAEQIVANSDAYIDRIKAELNLTPEQEKHWTGFNSAMHYLGHNGADRLNLRIARAKRDPPDDIVEQMRNEAQFLNDRAVDQRSVADAAEPLYMSLDDKQKAIFIQEMVRLSHERGLD